MLFSARLLAHRLRPVALGLLAALSTAAPAAAQWPGEVAGRVVEEATGDPVPLALIEIPDLGRVTEADPAGRFRMGGLEPGRYALRASRLGYAAARVRVDVDNGRTAQVRFALARAPIEAEAIRLRLPAGPGRPGYRVGRDRIRTSGARTAGDAVALAPGVVVRREGPAGPQLASIRGSSPDAVLVLLDGTPINDPLTGEADLSTVPASALESVTVLPGAQSARFGPRAEAGVVVLESQATAAPTEVAVSAGSLGHRALRASAGGAAAGLAVAGGGGARSVDGEFDFALPDEVGGGKARRENADLAGANGFLVLRAEPVDGILEARLAVEVEERGLPGRSFAPSPTARRDLSRIRLAGEWRRMETAGALGIQAHFARLAARHRDPDPPLGSAYDDETRLLLGDLRLDHERALAIGGSWGLAVETRLRQVDSDVLADEAPTGWVDGGAGIWTTFPLHRGTVDFDAVFRLRVDRDAPGDAWHASHDIALEAVLGDVSLQAAHRSAVSPPALGDLFFREGVAVEANPDLRAERVPSEIEIGATLRRDWIDVGMRGYVGDVEDMIVWAPDFRFVWRPQNEDVERRGVEAWLEASPRGTDIRLRASYGYARVTYDPTTHPDPVQVVYRPRHSGQASIEWTPGPWWLRLEARGLGARTTAPTRVNVLDPF